jgi:3-deoxy-D-manno-octulosonic-acid transferase
MFRIILTAYSLVYTLLGILYAGFSVISSRNRSVILSRLRFPGASFFKSTAGNSIRIWVHAVSVGEVNAVRPLATALLESGYELFFSTTTRSGQELAQSVFGEQAKVLYFPVDLRKPCSKILHAMRPAAIVLVETEIWPNFIATARQLSVPIVLVNGRISDKSFRNYERFRFFFRHLWKYLSKFCMQSKADKERILSLGAEEAKVHWTGNLKYDLHINTPPSKAELVEQLNELLKSSEESLLWLCGSTKPGEEEIILKVYSKLKQRFDSLRLLIAPRHPERSDEIALLIQAHGFPYTKRSLPESWKMSSEGVFLLDSIGDLVHLYQLADIVFIGGSLVPQGGQNPLEPAYFGCPILFGPHMENFREVSETLISRYAALQVKSADELEQRIEDLLKDIAAREWLGRNARKVIRENRGAVDRTLRIIQRVIQEAKHQA